MVHSARACMAALTTKPLLLDGSQTEPMLTPPLAITETQILAFVAYGRYKWLMGV